MTDGSLTARVRAADRAADARARLYAGELRDRTARFARAMRDAGVAGDERLALILDEFLNDTRLTFDRMDDGERADFGTVIDIGTRRPQLTADEFSTLTREPA